MDLLVVLFQLVDVFFQSLYGTLQLALSFPAAMDEFNSFFFLQGIKLFSYLFQGTQSESFSR